MPEVQPRRPRPPRSPRPFDAERDRSSRRLPFGPVGMAVLGIVGVVLLALVVTFFVRQSHDGEALPGTEVVGRSLAGQDARQIRRTLEPVLSAERRLRLEAGSDTIRLTPASAGYSVDVPATARAAVQAGRDGILAGIPGTLAGLVSSRDVPVDDAFDERLLTRAVAKVAGQVDEDPYPGALEIDPDTRKVTTSISRPGRQVDREALARRIKAEVRAGERGPIAVPLEVVPAVPAGRLTELADDATEYLETPLRITFAASGVKPYVLGAGEQAKLLALEGREGGRSARLGVDDKQLAALVERVAEHVDRPAKDATLSADARGPKAEAGKDDVSWTPVPADVSVAEKAQAGRALDQADLEKAIRSAVRKGTHTVRADTKTTEPEITTAAAEKVDSEIGTFTTPYVAGQPRVTNIQQMARTIDGTEIAPGEQFSLNGLTGERTKEKGYVEAPFIADNKIEPSVGGGVSQFSTTMYNAAYFAGLQLDTHQPHSLYIDRYPPGREGTLNYPDIDLKWTNDTDAPILVRTAYDDEGVTVTLYGDNGGRKVKATAGPREKVDGGDFAITVTRTVTYPDGRVVRQPFTTRYENENTDSE